MVYCHQKQNKFFDYRFIIGTESKINSLITSLLSFFNMKIFFSSYVKQGKNEPLFDL
jgi:hypothetical protein